MHNICVIVPVYNAEEWIDRCLDSLLAQKYACWRAIVVDDGSTDSSPARVQAKAQSDSRILPVKGRHGGAAAARNQALDVAKSLEPDFITFLDADDYLEADALEAMLNMALETGAEIVHCKFFSDYASGYEYTAKDLFPAGAVYPAARFSRVYWKMITGIQMNHVCTKLYRASLLRDMRFDESMPTGEDLLMNVEVFSRAASYAYLARPLYHYIRDTQSGLTNASLSWRVKMRSNWRISRRMLEALPEWGMNRWPVKLCVVARPVCILFSKAYRAARSKFFSLTLNARPGP